VETTPLPSFAAIKVLPSLYYTRSKEFMEAGMRRLAGDIARAATTDGVKDLRRETRDLTECVADLTLEKRLLQIKA
tara:strand:- start:11 stop:238 length:228 start_codon:yes stop_codon:yes gene_type:complete